MELDALEYLSDHQQDALLAGLLAFIPKERVASVICRVYDSDEDIEQLVFLIETVDLPEADME